MDAQGLELRRGAALDGEGEEPFGLGGVAAFEHELGEAQRGLGEMAGAHLDGDGGAIGLLGLLVPVLRAEGPCGERPRHLLPAGVLRVLDEDGGGLAGVGEVALGELVLAEPGELLRRELGAHGIVDERLEDRSRLVLPLALLQRHGQREARLALGVVRGRTGEHGAERRLGVLEIALLHEQVATPELSVGEARGLRKAGEERVERPERLGLQILSDLLERLLVERLGDALGVGIALEVLGPVPQRLGALPGGGEGRRGGEQRARSESGIRKALDELKEEDGCVGPGLAELKLVAEAVERVRRVGAVRELRDEQLVVLHGGVGLPGAGGGFGHEPEAVATHRGIGQHRRQRGHGLGVARVAVGGEGHLVLGLGGVGALRIGGDGLGVGLDGLVVAQELEERAGADVEMLDAIGRRQGLGGFEGRVAALQGVVVEVRVEIRPGGLETGLRHADVAGVAGFEFLEAGGGLLVVLAGELGAGDQIERLGAEARRGRRLGHLAQKLPGARDVGRVAGLRIDPAKRKLCVGGHFALGIRLEQRLELLGGLGVVAGLAERFAVVVEREFADVVGELLLEQRVEHLGRGLGLADLEEDRGALETGAQPEGAFGDLARLEERLGGVLAVAAEAQRFAQAEVEHVAVFALRVEQEQLGVLDGRGAVHLAAEETVGEGAAILLGAQVGARRDGRREQAGRDEGEQDAGRSEQGHGWRGRVPTSTAGSASGSPDPSVMAVAKERLPMPALRQVSITTTRCS